MTTAQLEKQTDRAIAKLRKLLDSPSVESAGMGETGDWFIVKFKNGQVFGMRGAAVDIWLKNASDPVPKKVKNYTVPKAGEKIGRVLTGTLDDMKYKPVFVAAEFMHFQEIFAVQKTKAGLNVYHKNTGKTAYNYPKKDISAAVDQTIKKLDGMGEEVFKSAILQAIAGIDRAGNISVLETAPE